MVVVRSIKQTEKVEMDLIWPLGILERLFDMTTGDNGKFVLIGEISAVLPLVMASCGKSLDPPRLHCSNIGPRILRCSSDGAMQRQVPNARAWQTYGTGITGGHLAGVGHKQDFEDGRYDEPLDSHSHNHSQSVSPLVSQENSIELNAMQCNEMKRNGECLRPTRYL